MLAPIPFRCPTLCQGLVESLLPRLSATVMTPDAVLELSVEQLIATLNKKLSTEFTRVQPTTLPVSRALVATLAAEVRVTEPHGNLPVLITPPVGRRSGETTQRDSARSGSLEEPPMTSKLSPS